MPEMQEGKPIMTPVQLSESEFKLWIQRKVKNNSSILNKRWLTQIKWKLQTGRISEDTFNVISSTIVKRLEALEGYGVKQK